VTRAPGGRVTSIHNEHGLTINRGTVGGRRIETVRPGGGRVVSVAHGRGFVERPLVARRGFVQRTYFVHGRSTVRIYRSYSYHGIYYHRFVPGYYYGPRFYGWAYNPWPGPVVYGWGWGAEPWFYGGYFAPAPFYPSASFWLTDYLLAENLQAAYEARQEANSGDAGQAAPPPDATGSNASGQVALTPQVRQAIAEEVQRQLDAERAAASNPQQVNSNTTDEQAPPALNPANRTFVVSASLDVEDVDKPCELTPGDVVSRVDDNPDGNSSVRVAVIASKSADCKLGAMPKVLVSDLQEMQNDLHARMDSGLKTLASNQGKNGIPPAPDSTPIVNKDGSGVADSDVATQLQQQQADADQTEKEVKQAGQGGQVASNDLPDDANPAPVSVPAQVFAAPVTAPLNPMSSDALSANHATAKIPAQTIKNVVLRLFASPQ
jgi:hypothetical protein